MSSKVTELKTESLIAGTTPRGTLFVVSSPSGGGKGTLIRRVLDVVPNLSYSVSYTTRVPRYGEVEGREYFFVNRPVFEGMIAAGEFLEWACVHGNLYGTAKHQVAVETAAGLDIILELDVQGADSVRHLLLDSVSGAPTPKRSSRFGCAMLQKNLINTRSLITLSSMTTSNGHRVNSPRLSMRNVHGVRTRKV